MTVTENENNELINRQWLNRQTTVDDILGLIGQTNINRNTKLDNTNLYLNNANLKLDELIELSGGTLPIRDILPGDIGVSLAVGEEQNIISCVINGITTNAIARSYISRYESIVVVPGGTSFEPYVVSTAIIVKGVEGDTPTTFAVADVGADIDGLKAQVCDTLIYGEVSDGVTVPFAVDGSGNINVSSDVRTLLEINGDTYFTDGLATDVSENENLAISDNKITIKNVTILSLENLNYRLWFYTKDTFLSDNIIGYVDLNLPTSGVTKVIGATTYYVYSVVDVDQQFEDLDDTTELHLQLENKSAAAKTAGAVGRVQLTIVYGINN